MSSYNGPAFWERLWRSSGLQFVGLFIIAWVIYGSQPPVGAGNDALIAFYHGDRTRILIAVLFFGLNLLNLLWFTTAVRAVLAEARLDGWGGGSNRRKRGLRSAVSPAPRRRRCPGVLDRQSR